jgi:hypothetical protein
MFSSTITPFHAGQSSFADEERFELSTFGLTNRCSAVELSIPVGPERLELSTPGVKDRYSDPIELRTNFVATAGFEPATITL